MRLVIGLHLRDVVAEVIEDLVGGIVLRPARLLPSTKPDDVFGILKFDGAPKSIEDMKQGIDAGLNERWEREPK